MALWRWLATANPKVLKNKTPLLPETTDEISQNANDSVDRVVLENAGTHTKRRREYSTYDDELRAKIAQYACLNRQRKAGRHFSEALGHLVNQSTIAHMVRQYR